MLRALGDAQSVEIDMLQNLRFVAIEDRYQAIPAAHQKTFRWIFDQPSQEDTT